MKVYNYTASCTAVFYIKTGDHTEKALEVLAALRRTDIWKHARSFTICAPHERGFGCPITCIGEVWVDFYAVEGSDPVGDIAEVAEKAGLEYDSDIRRLWCVTREE